LKDPLSSIPGFAALAAAYRERYGMAPAVAADDVRNAAVLRQARRHALAEAVRWGEPYVFFLAPGLLSWMAAVMDGGKLRGGVVGGEVTAAEDPADVRGMVAYLVGAGCRRRAAEAYARSRPAWPQARTREAAGFLQEAVYRFTDCDPSLLTRNRENAQQQRQIAEAIHEWKRGRPAAPPFHEERMLLSLIRVGDRAGARSLLNRLLAATFLDSPRPALVQARAIELIGYLVRAAIEDNPLLDTLLTQHRRWIEEIFAAADFESLCEAVRRMLDAFMDAVELQGFNREDRRVRAALDFMAAHLHETLSLADVGRAVGLSGYRLAHLVKEHTGRTAMQHLRRLRIERGRRLLEETDTDVADLAASLGFADQSHFIRQFRQFAGVTPARYRRARRGGKGPALTPHDREQVIGGR
jgi:two-component system response regulator YesN